MCHCIQNFHLLMPACIRHYFVLVKVTEIKTLVLMIALRQGRLWVLKLTPLQQRSALGNFVFPEAKKEPMKL